MVETARETPASEAASRRRGPRLSLPDSGICRNDAWLRGARHRQRLLDDAVDHSDQRRLFRAAERLHRLEARELAVGTRPALHDGARVRHLGNAAEIGGVLGDEVEQLLEQDGEGDDRALAEIDQALLDAIALRPPAILAHEEGRVVAPALVLPPQAIEQSQDAAIERGNGDAVLDQRADIGDAHFESRKARGRSQVPPDLGGILDQARIHQKFDGTLIFAIGRELVWHAGARELVEYRQPVGFEPGLRPLPKGR